MKTPLTKELLKRLRKEGFEVLECDREMPDEDAIITPNRVVNWLEYINNLNENVAMLFVIDEVLKWPEQDILGMVKLPEGFSWACHSSPST